MDLDVAKYQAYRKFIENLVFRAGLWPHRDDTVFIYRFITFTGFCMTTSVGTKVLFFCLSNVGNVSKFVETLQNALAVYAPVMRIVNYLVYRSELIALDKELGTKYTEELKNEKYRPVLLKKISFYSKFMNFLVISTGITIAMFLTPRFIHIFKYKKRMYLWPGNYPFVVEPTGAVYWTLVAYETGLFWFTFHVLSGVDNAFGMHCFHISALLRLAAARVFDLDPADPNYKSQLKECVAIHQLVIKSKTALQKIYGGIIIWNYCVSAIIMCSLLWQAQQIKSQMTVLKLIFFVAYIVMKLVQTFIYAYYGSAITSESEIYRNAVYTSSWPGSGNVRLMKDLLVILMQRTINLKACGYFLITMEMFEKIVNTTISYFFILQSLEMKSRVKNVSISLASQPKSIQNHLHRLFSLGTKSESKRKLGFRFNNLSKSTFQKLSACEIHIAKAKQPIEMDAHLAMYQRCRKSIDSLLYGAGIWPDRENGSLLYKLFTVYSLLVPVVIAMKCLYGGTMVADDISGMVISLRGVAIMCSAAVRVATRLIVNAIELAPEAGSRERPLEKRYLQCDPSYPRNFDGSRLAALRAKFHEYEITNERQQMGSCLLYRTELAFLESELCAKFGDALADERSRAVLLKNVSVYRHFINFLTLSIAFTALMYFIPLAVLVFKYKRHVQLYPGEYPFPVAPRSAAYWSIFAFETSSFWYLVCGIAGMDSAFAMHCFRIRGFLRLATELINDLSVDSPNCEDRLRECVSIHQLVLRANATLEKAYGYIVIYNYIGSAVIMCSVMWEANQNKAQLSVTKLLFVVVYMLMKLAQVFVYAYFGAAIAAESEQYQEAIYMSSWPGSGKVRLMKDFLIILMQRTVTLKACGFFLVTMRYFEKVCNTTLSYFFLLQTLDASD
ncbi:uncharacterized protein LOC131663998 [Phymastichus coffea]|uniref:uncharacterized protein LOC131663998 n=1 Tax=Phymastichus coffea TaxID=108790 RepID=UPI00273AA9AD|nr:uncharacterized protein LOC131663998 [Phymastichus coffea]